MKRELTKGRHIYLLFYFVGVCLLMTGGILFITGDYMFPVKGESQKSPSECTTEECLFTGATKYNDRSFCDKLENNRDRNLCEQSVEDSKLLDNAIKEQNITYCENFGTSDLDRRSCKDVYYLTIAERENRSILCDKIELEQFKEQCPG